MSLTNEEKRTWLATVPLFSGCSREVVEQLADVTGELAFEADDPIVQQGQVGNGLYIIVEGEARIVAGSTELARLGPGEFFGELSVIDQRPRTATVYADGPTRCLALASWDLVAVLEREPALAMNLLRELSARLRQADDQLRH